MTGWAAAPRRTGFAADAGRRSYTDGAADAIRPSPWNESNYPANGRVIGQNNFGSGSFRYGKGLKKQKA